MLSSTVAPDLLLAGTVAHEDSLQPWTVSGLHDSKLASSLQS